MKRVLIIGCGGSGKTTLARRLGEITKLPVVHLDQLYWSPGNWQHLDAEAFDRLLAQELEKPEWILDGNYNRTLPLRLEKCDTVLWLDYNRFVCIAQWIKRVIQNWGSAREDMAPGCKEWLDPEFFRWLWRFPKTYRSRYRSLLEAQREKQVLIFKNRGQLERFVRTL